MAQYLPKSKLNQLETQGGEFVHKGTNDFYSGPYIETSTGKYYAGDDIYNQNTELELASNRPSSQGNFGASPEVNIFNYLKKAKKKYLENIKEIVATRPMPTSDDYNNLKYKRYFAKKINSTFGYVEIDKKSYDDLKQKKNKSHDYNLYECGEIEWALVGDTKKINQNTLLLLEQTYPGITYLFQITDEFKSLDPLPPTLSKETNYDPYKGKRFE